MRPCPCPCPSNSIHAVLKSTTVFVSPPFASPRGCESVSSRDSFASMHCPTNDPNAFVYRQCRLHHPIRCRDIYIYIHIGENRSKFTRLGNSTAHGPTLRIERIENVGVLARVRIHWNDTRVPFARYPATVSSKRVLLFDTS